MNRRNLLKASLALTALGLPAFPAFAQGARTDPRGEPFDFDRLKQRAKELAGRPYQDNAVTLPPTLANLEPLKYQQIQYDPKYAIWRDAPETDMSLRFFHVGMQFNLPVRMHVIDPDTQQAHEVHFDPKRFSYEGSGVDQAQLEGQDFGYAGFKLMRDNDANASHEAGAFLGASYFRFLDKNNQYGISARGLAIDTATEQTEEFPDFVAFWFEQPHDDQQAIVYALLDSPAVAGAYRFKIDLTADGTVMDVDMELHTRHQIGRLGIAPMTSMFLKGTSQAQARDTIHPQVHDSDRLEMWRGNGEWVCRPLFNPKTLQYNAFPDENPRGFGLVQHDHDFDNYRDDVAWYNRRPSLWVEPTSDWGAGQIALFELPTVGETVDNIGAFWIPDEPVTGNQQLNFSYKLYWLPLPPVAPTLAQVEKTWSGMGNVPEGWIPGDRSPSEYARRFAVDFVGDPLDDLPDDTQVEVQVEVSRGKLGMVQARRFEPIQGYRAIFDWVPESQSDEAVSIRLYLRAGDRPLTETWLYQWVPPKSDERYY